MAETGKLTIQWQDLVRTKHEIDALMEHPTFYDSVLGQVDDRCLKNGFVYQLVSACQEDPKKEEKVLRMFASAAAGIAPEPATAAAGDVTSKDVRRKSSSTPWWTARKKTKKALPITPLLDDGERVLLTYEVSK